MKEILVDIETYSEVDIGKCGLYRYAADTSFEILLVAWATDEGDGFGETRCADLASGEVIPDELLEAFQTGNVRLIAHNAAFERVCFSVHLNRHYPGQYLKPGEFLSPDSWICTMVMAASLTLPLALKGVGTVLKTSQQKDKEGERLIKLFSVPCKPTKSNGMRTRNLPEHYPADWAKFKYYCIQDVNTEVDIYKRLKKFPMTELEWQHYRTNERINDRGVRIDTELVQEAITCDLMLSDAMSRKAYELTGLENPNSVSQLKTWLEERGIPMDTLGKKDVAQMIEELDKNGVDAEAMDMLKLRLQMAKSSVKKYQAAERCVCPDGRARGLFQFYGASRTGRYSGRNIQLQNLPQNHISTLDEARTLVKLGCFDMVESIYGNTPDVLSQLIRTMLIPKDGCEFIVADFSAIEARVLAWEAEEQWVLDAFQNGEDLYCATASQMFHVPVVKHGINGDLRQKGKIATLACGYGGSSGALISMGALQMGLHEEELPEIIDSWREANPKIVQYWWDTERPMEKNQDLSCGRMCQGPSPQTKGRTSKQSSKPSSVLKNRPPRCLRLRRKDGPMPTTMWETDGASRIEFLMHSGGAFPKEENVSTLSQILQTRVPQRYYLSPKACLGILRRASVRGKELPPVLKAALERQAVTEQEDGSV